MLRYRIFLFQRWVACHPVLATRFIQRKKVFTLLWTLLLFFGLQTIVLFFIHPVANAAWSDDNYSYREKLTFTHNASINTDRRIAITLNTATLITNGKMQSNCADSRFTDNNGKILRYQLTGTCNNVSTTYDVVFPVIYNGENYGYFYYGNPSAVSQSDSSVASVTSLVPSGGAPNVNAEEKGTTPVLNWKMDEGYGTTAQDTSRYQNNGTLSGGSAAATNINDASNFGDSNHSGKQVVRTSGGTLYAFLSKSGSCEIWKSSSGTSWTEQHGASNPSCDSSSYLAAAIDSTGVIHLTYIRGLNGLYYNTFSTGTDTFGSEALVLSGFSYYETAISIDSNNKPHIVAVDGDDWDGGSGCSSYVEYTNKVGAGWSSAILVATEFRNDFSSTCEDVLNATITIDEDNLPEIAYINGTLTSLVAVVGNLNNATSFTGVTVDVSVTNSFTQMTDIGIDTSGNTWISYIDATTGYVTLAKRIDGSETSAWSTGWTASLNDTKTGTQPSIAIDGTNIYTFYINSLNDVAYDKYTGSWIGEITLDTGSLRDVNAKWSYYNNNQGSTQIDYIYSDGTDVYWHSFSLSGGGGGSAPTFSSQDLCLTGTCLKFDGVGSVVSRTYSSDKELDPSTGDMSVSAWFRHTSTISGTDTLIARADGGVVDGVGYKVYMNSSGFLCFGIDTTAGSFTTSGDQPCSTASYADSKWHFMEAVKNSTNSMFLYIDGIQVAQDVSITASTISGTSTPFNVGADSDSSSNIWDGFIDEVKVYNYAKTAAQAQADYVSKNTLDGVTAQLGGSDPSNAIAQGLVGYWNLNNTATPSLDTSGNGNNGTWTASPTSTTGKFAKAISLASASSQYVTITDSASLSPTSQVTINAWINPTTNVTTRSIVVKDTAYRMTTNASSQLVCEIYSSGSWQSAATGASTLLAGSWQMVSCSYDAQNVKAFVNGNRDAASTITGTINDSASAVDIGRNNNTNYYNGSIDEVRIYNRSLSEQEIRALFDWAPGPVGYWNLDENTGTTANDKSGNENTGTLTNAPTWANGKFGGSVIFDGVNDSIPAGAGTTLDDLPTNGITIDAWIYPSSLGESSIGRIATKASGTTPTNGWTFHLNNTTANSLAFQADYNTTDLSVRSAANTVTLNAWNHVTVTWDGSTTATNVHMYVNGAETTYALQTNASGTYQTDAAQNLYIGNDSSGAATFDGRIDDVHVYNYVRNSKQIVSEMNAGHPSVGSPAGSPIGYWMMDEGYNTIAHDKSPNANNLTLSAASWTTNGKFGKAWNGDGTKWLSRADDDDFDFAAADNFSLSIWFRSDSAVNPGSVEYLLDKSLSSVTQEQGYAVYAKTSGFICFGTDADAVWSPADEVCTTTDVYDGALHHIIAMKTGTSKIELFLDKTLVSSKTTLVAVGTLANGRILYFGDRDGVDNGDEFNGDLDELKIYRYALSNSEIGIEYNQGKAQSMGSLSINADGTTASNSAARAYCPPGNSEGNCATGSDPSPIGEWLLDENTGTTAFDTSGTGNTGVGTGAGCTAFPKWTPGKVGPALSFNGTNQCVTVSDNSTLDIIGAITIEGWVKLNNISSAHDIAAKWLGAANCSYRLGVNSSGQAFLVISSNGTCVNAGTTVVGLTGSKVMSTNTWYHIAGVYVPSSSMTLYINGIKDATTTSVPTAIFSGTAELNIGSEQGGNLMSGLIDQVQVYNYARTQAQTVWDYSKGKPTGRWKFDECTGTTAYDASGNGFNGTLTPGAGSNTAAGVCYSNNAAHMWNDGNVGKVNTAIGLDGSDDYVVTGNIVPITANALTYQQVSWGSWVVASSSAVSKTILHKNKEFKLTTDASSKAVCSVDISAGAGFSATTAVSTTAIPLGTWSNLFCTYDGTNIKLYLNGTLNATSASVAGSITSTNTTAVSIGRDPAPSGQFQGIIDDVAIFNYMLTPHQVAVQNNAGAAVQF